MGYTTDFEGQFSVNPPLAHNHRAYLLKFSETRRMRRDAELAKEMPDQDRLSVGLDIGPEGAYFVGARSFAGQGATSDILDSNHPPHGQPALWCQWIPNEDGSAIVWDGNEKFYNYVEWIEYLIEHFLGPWGYMLNGQVEWSGEENGDSGVIYIKDNKVKAVEDEIRREEPEWE